MGNLFLWEFIYLSQHLFVVERSGGTRTFFFFFLPMIAKAHSQKGMGFFNLLTVSTQMSSEPVASYPDNSPGILRPLGPS